MARPCSCRFPAACWVCKAAEDAVVQAQEDYPAALVVDVLAVDVPADSGAVASAPKGIPASYLRGAGTIAMRSPR